MRYRPWLATTLVAVSLLGAISVTGVRAQGPPRGRRHADRESQEKPAPKVGDVAPPFKLKTLDGKGEVALTDFSGKRPVVLFFGSYT